MPEIGDQLRETRMRQRIDITEVEAATKIRAKYLRALENEEWDLLPGPTFVKTFLRSYADYLGLDSRQLVEEYKQRFERPSTMDDLVSQLIAIYRGIAGAGMSTYMDAFPVSAQHPIAMTPGAMQRPTHANTGQATGQVSGGMHATVMPGMLDRRLAADS